MNKKGLVCLFLFLLTLSFSACQKAEEPVATLAPGITRKEGGIVSTNPPAVEGIVSKVKEDMIVLTVEGVEWELALNERTKWEVQRFAELDMPIQRGNMLIVYYEEKEDDVREATKLEHVKMN